jgi:hypothetical protein
MNRAHAVVASFKSHGVDDISKGLLAKNCGIAHWQHSKRAIAWLHQQRITSTTEWGFIGNQFGLTAMSGSAACRG